MTRLLVIDHVTSQTALVFLVGKIAREMKRLGIDVLVDGVHAPGMLPLRVNDLLDDGVTYYAGTFHKWVYSPKGTGFLVVRLDRQTDVHPAVTITDTMITIRAGRSIKRNFCGWEPTTQRHIFAFRLRALALRELFAD